MKIIFILLTVCFLASCAHHKDVRRGADGLHKVVVATDDKDEGTQDAISQANHYCKQFDKEAAFVEEKATYKGDMNEKDYIAAQKVAKVAKVVGGSTYVLGGKNESGIGGIVGLGGVATEAAIGRGYQVEMKFKCQ